MNEERRRDVRLAQARNANSVCELELGSDCENDKEKWIQEIEGNDLGLDIWMEWENIVDV